MSKDRVMKGAFMCLLASVAWGAMFPVAESAFTRLDPFYFTLIRYSSVSVILLILLWVKEGRKALSFEGKAKQLWFFGTMAFTVYNLLIFWGQNQLGTSGVILASVMEALMPILSVLVLWIYKQRRPEAPTILCIVVALIGCFMVITKGDLGAFFVQGGAFPVMLIFAAVLGWVIYTIGGGQFKDWSVLRYSTLTCVLGTATSAVIVLTLTAFGVLHAPSAQTIMSTGYELSFMIIVAGLMALISWNAGIKLLTPINGILFINFVPVTTFIITLLQGHQMTVYDVGGTLLIIAALIGNNLYQRRRGSLAAAAGAAH
ncbi:DMT family transporter [Paenibacillus doosanensis]|uniref:EamA-like transporter family protein n=1 Tax=Paenibacillus konkukensis TaxID=2020716 RepID=A0ABY4RPU6_9BACL|nr:MULTISPECIES: DMT family transporter [Paenibacillus]MCS7459131.1 DMT family transporter [Paenibacillus doosanensis]UQZ84188.1 EamA-like transporter family protein [Paenibacillus konkukensis]